MTQGTLGNVVHRIRRLVAVPDEETTDARLLRRFVRHRDEAAFVALVERHGPMVLGLCRRILRDEHEAEDAFQATFLVLSRKAAAIRKPGSLASWLYGVAARIARAARERAGRLPRGAPP